MEGVIGAEGLLNQLPNGGAVAAILFLVWMHMRQQERYEGKQGEMMSKFLDEVGQARVQFFAQINESRRDYLEQLNRIVGRMEHRGDPPDMED